MKTVESSEIEHCDVGKIEAAETSTVCIERRQMSDLATEKMSTVETRQMSDLADEEISVVKTGQMSSLKTGEMWSF